MRNKFQLFIYELEPPKYDEMIAEGMTFLEVRKYDEKFDVVLDSNCFRLEKFPDKSVTVSIMDEKGLFRKASVKLWENDFNLMVIN